MSSKFCAWRKGEVTLFVKRIETLVVLLCGIILYPEGYIKEYSLCKIHIRVYVGVRIFVSFYSKTN